MDGLDRDVLLLGLIHLAVRVADGRARAELDGAGGKRAFYAFGKIFDLRLETQTALLRKPSLSLFQL
ncbi:MAG: hypothetical protein LBK41_07540 [Clostridiales bacterium]|nr:hypothetical protein [Clostridiales bacterium]